MKSKASGEGTQTFIATTGQELQQSKVVDKERERAI